MVFVDTHTHLFVEQFDADREEMVQRALDQHIKYMLLPNIDSSTIESMMELVAKFPKNCFPMMGLHPCSVKQDFRKELGGMKEWLDKGLFCAVGEMGLDLYWDKTFYKEQQEAFLLQANWAKELSLPIVIHSREATKEAIDLLKSMNGDHPTGVFHCFGGSVEEGHQIMDLGMYMGIGGVLTYKKAGLKDRLKDIPLDYLILETDSPYLAPVPFRGKRNESAYIRQIAQELASVYQTSEEKIANITTTNAINLFPKVFGNEANK